MPELILDGIRKSFGSNTVLEDLSLTVKDGQVLTLLGPSGCGKSTTLWSIAGLHRPDAGRISFGDRVVYDGGKVNVAPERRNCGVVFQSYAVWPHLSVFDNVGYPLKIRKIGASERRRRVLEVLELVELSHLADRFPNQLSGGQQQRVALARALAHPPDILLLDEPFSNLDAKLRERSRDWLRALQQQVGVTTLFVTHDQDEALSMSDVVVVMDRGRIRQVGTPREVYQRPADAFVADFVGSANLLPATIIEADGRRALVRISGMTDVFEVPHVGRETGEARLMIRPEAVNVLSGQDATGPNVIRAKIKSSLYLGNHFRYAFDVGNTSIAVMTTRPAGSEEVVLQFPAEDLMLFEPESDSSSTTRD